MNQIITIFLKELKDILRDRRTLMAMMLFPLLLVPAILSVSTSFQASQEEEAMTKVLNIALIENGNGARGAEFAKALEFKTDFKIIKNVPVDALKKLVKGDSLDAAIVLAPTFDEAIVSGRSAGMEYYFNSTDASQIRERISGAIDYYEKVVLAERMDSLGISDAMIDPIQIVQKDVYTQEESIGKLIGGFMPYIFVLFCLMGAMYPTIDLFTGEKERGTIETILTVPASRLQILFGKMGVVVVSGVISGLMAIVGMYLALKMNPDAPEFFVNMINKVLNPISAGLIIAMLIPLTTFFAGGMIPVAIYAKSFKEAQSMIQPAMIVVIMPLVIGMMPGIQLNYGTALIPILNVALASKEIIAGTIDYSMLAVVFASLIAIAAVGVMISIRQFGKRIKYFESVINACSCPFFIKDRIEMKVEYDKYYQTENLFGAPYPELIEFYSSIEQRGKLLDLGCGQGRDSIALAELGFEVMGIDYSKIGIEQLNKIARKKKLPLIGLVDDIYSYSSFDAFDFILLDSMFHFDKKDRTKEVHLLKRILAEAKINAQITICIQKTGNKLKILNEVIENIKGLEMVDNTDLIYKYEDKASNHSSETAYKMITVRKV